MRASMSWEWGPAPFPQGSTSEPSTDVGDIVQTVGGHHLHLGAAMDVDELGQEEADVVCLDLLGDLLSGGHDVLLRC